MQPQTVEKRVENLETRVTALEQLPARMDALVVEISQFRNEMRAEFSATRAELRGEMRAGNEETCRTLREEMRAGNDQTCRTLRGEIRGEIRASEERILTQVRVLHEDVISRLVVIQEAGPRRRKRR